MLYVERGRTYMLPLSLAAPTNAPKQNQRPKSWGNVQLLGPAGGGGGGVARLKGRCLSNKKGEYR